ncbi:DUF4360 domain-containing protein [Cryptosporangium sp. NPDC051539]|uniref:DUF4360 domain-containing protein n=1 Tax=Cryptosporangium sp. NPDC051539 TaxID=3363962 RepID=UPI003787A1B2
MPGRTLKTARRLGLAALGVLGLLLSTVEPVTAHVRADDPPPGQFGMTVESVNGTGCPFGTATVTPNGDKTAFTVAYSNYSAQAGGGVPALQARASCLLTVSVSVPQGFTFGINRTTFRGFADLAPGATGTLSTQYWFVGQAQTGQIRRDYSGPFTDNWQATDEIPLATMQWMPCRANYPLNINSQLLVRAGSQNPKTTSVMTMDATDSEITTLYNIAWRRCG